MRICLARFNNSNKKLYVHLKMPMKDMRRVGANLGEVIFHECCRQDNHLVGNPKRKV
jgi:hypothetical protein